MQALDGLYAGLDAIWNTEFPKTCPTCGRVYPNIHDYLRATDAPAGNTGLMDIEADESERQVGLFRNCACGSTLMTFCNDRRDFTDGGLRRRELFGQLLERLTDAGIPKEPARGQLLLALKTGKLARLESTFQKVALAESQKNPVAPLD